MQRSSRGGQNERREGRVRLEAKERKKPKMTNRGDGLYYKGKKLSVLLRQSKKPKETNGGGDGKGASPRRMSS